MAADVLCGVRSYVQTRFLATEDSSTLTNALCVFVLKTYLAQIVEPAVHELRHSARQ